MNRMRVLIISTAVMLALIAAGVLGAWIVVQIINIGGNTVSVGTPLNADVGVSPASAIWPAVSGIGPGQGSFGNLQVHNNGAGSPASWISLSATHSNPVLAAGLKLRVVDTTTTPNELRCKASSLAADGSPVALLPGEFEVYNGTLAAFAIGNPALGQQAGDIRLSAGYEVPYRVELCFSVMFATPGDPAMAGLANTSVISVHSDPSP